MRLRTGRPGAPVCYSQWTEEGEMILSWQPLQQPPISFIFRAPGGSMQSVGISDLFPEPARSILPLYNRAGPCEVWRVEILTANRERIPVAPGTMLHGYGPHVNSRRKARH